MHERAFRFGRASHLVGIAGIPAAIASETGVVLLNAGLVHRIGPFRLHVDLTRRLNALGYATLRFDLSTVGDSSSSGQSQTKQEQVCADVDDAMRLLAGEAGCTRFVLMGLCSGAQNAHIVACTDPKVAGAIFLDGYAYRTIGYRFRYYVPKIFDMARWRRMLSRGSQTATDKQKDPDPVFAVAPSPRDVVRADFVDMVARGMKIFLIYSGGISNYFNHRRQFRECFGPVMSDARVTTTFVRESDHTYILTGDRHRLVERIEQWLSRNFPVPAVGTSS
ncbi:hypothetical protein EC912_101617 [Luteibacter rhizovicinus]|uniref:AB hydrolase-1 domain-containing protein n=1 Tax=Luteibacter rhizovicinus TaxID=242606 RepID=A0A4R3YY74_9GAMM|nr:alpha/beta fold hydrolase [Luteibacter rhizovicinus]TCV97600.1 hypothetical protein EC912_101617 [Luteibacter rhizovicinus]